MPKLFMVSGYTVYFWSNENNEPIHVHVAKGKPTPNATKIWLTKSGGCIVASNGSKISNILPKPAPKERRYPISVALERGLNVSGKRTFNPQ